MGQPQPLIQMWDVHKVYAMGMRLIPVLRGIHLTVHEGEFIAITGKSGSGKSTLLHLLGCLDLPTQGTYQFNGVRATELDDKQLSYLRNRQIGFVFQTFNLIPQLTVLENVEVPLLYSGVGAGERQRRCLPLIEKVGLLERIHHTPSQLSGGEMQRVAIARALVNDPLLILADEPTGNLDTTTSKEIMELLAELNHLGRTIMVVTHESTVASYAKKVLRLCDGVLET